MDDPGSIIFKLVLLFVLILVNAFFAMSEIAIISLNDNMIDKLAEEGHKKAKLIKKLTENPSNFLSTIQIGVTLAGFLTSASASTTFAEMLADAVIKAIPTLPRGIIEGVMSGAPYVQAALSQTLGKFGPVFITIAMILFAFTTLLGNLYYVDQCVAHIMKKVPSKKVQHAYHIVAAVVIFVGAGLSADMLWNIADVTMGAMTLINMPVIFILSKYAVRAINDYVKQRKEGIEPVFKAKDIDLPHDVDCWK